MSLDDNTKRSDESNTIHQIKEDMEIVKKALDRLTMDNKFLHAVLYDDNNLYNKPLNSQLERLINKTSLMQDSSRELVVTVRVVLLLMGIGGLVVGLKWLGGL